ncbi:MAG: DUF2207 domain-containing protein [Microthrixaceae bacterium]
MKSRTSGTRFAAVAFSIVVLGATALLVFVDPINTGGDTPSEPSTITNYSVDMVVDSDGKLTANEDITVSFPIARRGIFRIFDTQNVRGRDFPIESLSVTKDGQPENWVWNDSAYGTATARIGNENIYLNPGEYTYGLTWTTDDVLEPYETVDGETDPEQTMFFWQPIGSGWPMPILDSEFSIQLPAEPTSVECRIGDDLPCDVRIDGDVVSATIGSLNPNEPVTVLAAFPADQVPANGDQSELWWLAVITGMAGLTLGSLGVAATRERAPGFPVLYEPPAGIRPAVGVRVLDERPSSEELQATLFDLGARGIVNIAPDGEKWTINLVGDPANGRCEDWEVKTLSKLGLRTVGDSFTVSKTVGAGKKISKAKETLEGGATVAASPYIARSGVGGAVAILGWLTGVGLVVMAGFWLFGGVDFPLWLISGLAGFAIPASIVATDVGRSTTRTESGRDVWSRTGGFARFLTTDSSESRFDAAAHLDWFPRYLPWALALGVSEEWAKRYEAQGVDLPAVPYVYGWGYGMGYGHGYRSFSDSFSSSISSASAAYAASQSSSGGGGGGFSGGGGGGGGGGSW